MANHPIESHKKCVNDVNLMFFNRLLTNHIQKETRLTYPLLVYVGSDQSLQIQQTNQTLNPKYKFCNCGQYKLKSCIYSLRLATGKIYIKKKIFFKRYKPIFGLYLFKVRLRVKKFRFGGFLVLSGGKFYGDSSDHAIVPRS